MGRLRVARVIRGARSRGRMSSLRAFLRRVSMVFGIGRGELL